MEQETTRKKIIVADLLLEMLAKDDDPRAPEVARILGEQRAELVAQLDEQDPASSEEVVARDDSGKPPAQVVGLKNLSLKAKRL